MGFLNSEGLEYLVNKLSDSSNIKIAGNPNGTRVGAVVDKLVEKTDTVTGAVDMEIENEVGSFKVGTGLGSTDVSATVEDGFSEIEIKGNTVQNLVLEDNVEVVPSGAMVSAEATSLKLDTASGNVDMSIKGRTLQNVIAGAFDQKSVNWVAYKFKHHLFKPNTTYTVIINFDISEINTMRISNNPASVDIMPVTVVTSDRVVFTTPSSIEEQQYYIFIYPKSSLFTVEKYNADTVKYTVLEGDYTNTPLSELPYIEGIQSVGEQEDNVVEVKSCGKNLFDFNNIVHLTNLSSSNGEFTQIQADTSPTIMWKLQGYKGSKYVSYIPTVNGNNRFTFSLPEGIDRLALGINGSTTDTIFRFTFDKLLKVGSSYTISWNMINSTQGSIKFNNVQLEEGTTATPYEPYQEDTAQITLEEPLRSLPNGVCDEIKDGKLIRRVGKLVLDGSESWVLNPSWDNYEQKTHISFYLRNDMIKKQQNDTTTNRLICDRFTIGGDTGDSDGASRKFSCVNLYRSAISTNSQYIYMIIERSKLSTLDANGLKQWLQANPTTMYYELETPVITELGQSINLDTYTGTTHMTSTNYLSPKIKVNSKGKAYETLLKPNTDYTVKWRAAEGGANLDLNLGGTAKTVDKTLGSTTIKTPTTLADSNLYVAGWGSKVRDVMVVEGNLGNTPFVEGIVGVGDKSKNLFNCELELGGLNNTTGVEVVSINSVRSVDYIQVTPNTTYTLSNNLGYSNYVHEYDLNNNMIKLVSQKGINTFKTQPTTTKIKIRSTSTEIQNNLSVKYQLELGNSATSHVPHGKYKIEILSNGKNLTTKQIVLGAIDYGGGYKYSISYGALTRATTDGVIKRKHFSKLSANVGNGYCIVIQQYDKNLIPTLSGDGGWRKIKEENLVLHPNTCYINIYLRREDEGKLTEQDLEYFNSFVSLEESVSVTPHEPYKENKSQILLDEPLMRLPNGVCDEITVDGKLIRRVGKAILDSDYDYTIHTYDPPEVGVRYRIPIPLIRLGYDSVGYCNTMPVQTNSDIVKTTGLSKKSNNHSTLGNIVYCCRNDMTTTGQFKEWLKNNPTTIYYELAEPIITQLNPIQLHVYKDGHLTFNTTVAPTSTHKVLLNKSAQIEDSVREVQSLDARVGKLENFYDEMILETSHRLNLLDLDFDYIRESEEE